MKTKIEIQQEIFALIKKHYKSSECHYVSLTDTMDYAIICDTRLCVRNYPFIAKRILNNYPQIRVVMFIGGFQDYVYTRNTLKWLAV